MVVIQVDSLIVNNNNSFQKVLFLSPFLSPLPLFLNMALKNPQTYDQITSYIGVNSLVFVKYETYIYL